MTLRKILSVGMLLGTLLGLGQSPEGYELWLRNLKVEEPERLNEYRNLARSIYFPAASETLRAAQKELTRAMEKMLELEARQTSSPNPENTLIIATRDKLESPLAELLAPDFEQISGEGFMLKSIRRGGKPVWILSAHKDIGILYGIFRLLHLMRTRQSILEIDLTDSPRIGLRMLNHWDNLDRTVERGYAGSSLWNWHKLPEIIDQRYIDYARANASVGINAVSLNNVNANALVLTPMYLEKVAALAEVFRPYGIKVFLTARFSAPMEIGELQTADPMDPQVQSWWKAKADEIYDRIPDFGGFLVKANSEGQPGPQDYGRSHAEGANMLAEALKDHVGLVIWRAFVYDQNNSSDRAKQAFDEFVPLDGLFLDNVLVQVKNGPIDFQPREPFHPMFGAMPQTPLMMEFQITQEYLGFSTHLVFLPALFEEVLDSDTHRKGKGSTVARVVDGSVHGQKLTGMAGVANTGADLNWTGHPFAQANWYGFGRLAWDPYLSSATIAEEWLKASYSTDPDFVEPVKALMLDSREAVVNYMTPLGLHHIFDSGHHYGPAPWVNDLSRPEWNPTYYHQADGSGIGFDRGPQGSHATLQYAVELASVFEDPKTCPEAYLLWFHHLPWDFQLQNGLSLWDGMALKYQQGVEQVGNMISTWETLRSFISEAQFREVQMLLKVQLKEAKWWRDACLLYFQTFSKRELPEGVERPEQSLQYFQSLKFPYAPGIRPKWDE